jgi:hypothetical protein
MKKEEKQPEINTETATQKFYREVAELKPLLPKDWKMQFIKQHPEYDSYRGGLILHNVINGSSTDTVVLQGLKEIVEQSKP